MQPFRFLPLIGVFLLCFAFPAYAATAPGVPFTSQAPFGNWARPWQEFCEEASVVMAAHFLWNAPLSPKIADAEMRIIKKYEELVLGKYEDTSAEETASILKNLYGFKGVEVKTVTSPEDIKKEISSGRIVIVPAAGRMLKNPYFKLPGPLYHMLVVYGFDDESGVFITNDPGTSRGKGFRYRQTLLLNAIHDWNNGDVMEGEKKMIVVGRG
ncbi:MAG: Uncharacterized protein G01um101433_606 [Parcubacteria group bacterium Gr01-1014_33]|nr:MAG: Uncharacterized protein G01um101433_606 [Parcubacteria group bacterium Gr01-1014_33]